MKKKDLKDEIDELVSERDNLLFTLGMTRDRLREALEALDEEIVDEDEDEDAPLAD